LSLIVSKKVSMNELMQENSGEKFKETLKPGTESEVNAIEKKPLKGTILENTSLMVGTKENEEVKKEKYETQEDFLNSINEVKELKSSTPYLLYQSKTPFLR